MKKFNLKSKPVMITIIVVGLLIICGLVVIISNIINSLKNDDDVIKEKVSSDQTTVYINKPYKNAKKISSKKLSKEHCVDDVCVKDLVIYYTKESNNIELSLANKSKKPATGYLKVVFGSKAMTVAYKDLAKGKDKPYTIQLGKTSLSDTSDFTVRKLTKEELAMIKK